MHGHMKRFWSKRLGHTHIFLIEIDFLMKNWISMEKIFGTEIFLRIALKSISSDIKPKQHSDPDFDFSEKVGFSMKNFCSSKNHPKIL